MAKPLQPDEITRAVTVLNAQAGKVSWKVKDSKLCKMFVFDNFIDAFSWMTQCAIWAEKLDHHPEWCNVYKRVDVNLITHDAGGLTELDFSLARKMDLCAQYFIVEQYKFN